MAMNRLLLLLVAISLFLSPAYALATEPIPIRKLWGKKYSEAVAARDRADLMRAEYEKYLSGPPEERAKRPKRSQQQTDAEAAQVVQAYQEVVDRYPHTEIAAYCTMRLSGFYIFTGKLDKAVGLMEQMATEFAGTHEETRVVFELGLIHAQSRHDPAEAIKWLSRIPKPVKPAGAQYDEADKLYLSAQEQLTKCELQLLRDDEAKNRLEKLKQVYPQYAKEVDHFYQFEIQARKDANASEPKPKPVTTDSVEKRTSPSKGPVFNKQNIEIENATEQLYEAIRNAPWGNTVSEDVRRQIANLRKVTGADPSNILREFYEERGGSVQERTAILRALQHVGTPQALAAIKQIAMKPGKEAETLGPQAVKAFVALTDDPDQIGQLLDSASPEVRGEAVMALSGRKLTDATVRRLGDFAHSDSRTIHSNIAAAFFTDKSTATVSRKVDVILATLPQLEHLADAESVIPELGRTSREMALGGYIYALATMAGAEPILRQKRDEFTPESVERKAVVLALAWRAYKSVHSPVLQIARDDKDGFLRLMAVIGLGTIGSPEDISFLKRLADVDDYTRSQVNDFSGGKEQTEYPVRWEAKRAITKIEKRANTPQPQQPNPPSDTTLEDSVDRLGRLKPGAETDQAVGDLARQGDKAVAEIGKQLEERDVDYGWRHNAVRVLKAVNTEKSRALLRRMALGELSGGNPNLAAWAAQALIACDRREAWALLNSTSPEALTTALNAIDGQTVDKEYISLLKKQLGNKNPLVSWRAAEVMAAGASGKLADEAVEAIGQALTAVASLPHVDEPDPKGYRFGTVSTLGEQYYFRYTNALERAHVDNRTLHNLAERLHGRARNTVVLALVRRGDKSVHNEVVMLAQDLQAGLFRAWAARGLGEIGIQDDLPLLRTLAENDPLIRNGPLAPPHPIDSLGPTYPVREAAKGAIHSIEKRERERTAK
jgi:HEAT repeat protein